MSPTSSALAGAAAAADVTVMSIAVAAGTSGMVADAAGTVTVDGMDAVTGVATAAGAAMAGAVMASAGVTAIVIAGTSGLTAAW